MVKRYKGGLISATEATTSTTVSSGMWSATTAAQARKAGAWPSLLASEPPASTGGGSGPTISNVSVTNSSYTVLNDTPYISTAGGYIKITGTGFASGCTVYVGGSAATSTTFVSSTEVRAQIGAASSNSYMVYVVNPDNSTGILLNAVAFSGTPTWVTSTTLSDQLVDVAFSIELSATSDSSVTYALTAGSSTPSGTTLYSNGVFSGTVTGLSVDTNYSFSVDATDAENQDTARTFTVNIVSGDTYFYITPLLLNGDANVWITDASTNRFFPTINADLKPTAFSPYNSGWSVYFNGASYLDVAASTTFNEFLTGDFTVECWFHYTGAAFTSGPSLISVATTWSTSVAYQLEVRTGGAVYFAAGDSVPIVLTSSGGQLVSINTWNHVAASRVSGITTLYVNGANAAVHSGSVSISKPSQLMRIGAFSSGGGQQWTGYISNARIVKGQGLYTANFTPSTTSLTITSQGVTSANVFLGCGTNRFIDANTTPKTVTIGAGSPRANTFAPFAETDTITGSAYFDGTGDYLDYSGSANLAFDTSDWTIEFWVYFVSISGDVIIYDSRPASTNGAYPTIYKHTDNSFRYYTNTGERIASTTSVVANTWFHVAVARVSGSTRMFVNGIVQTTVYSDSTTYLNGASRPRIGDSGVTVGAAINAYISDLRVLKGTGLYTANFTPATSSLSSVANTQLLTLQYRRGENNHRFVDEGGRKYPVLRNGQVSQGSFSPFSPAGWSGYFDGTGDYLTVTGSSNLAFGANNFTIECFVYFNDVSTSGFIYDSRTASSQATPTLYFGGGAIFYYVSGSIRITSSTIVTNRWYHIMVSRVSGSTRMFLDGTQTGSTYTDATTYINNTNRPLIGTNGDATNFFLNGYISNLRVLNGTGYTTVTVPTSRLTTTSQNAANCQLLTLQDNRFVDNSSNAFAITRVNDARIQAYSPFRPSGSYSPALHGGSAYFDGSGDNLSALATSMTLLPLNTTNTFTVDGWIYPTTTGTRYWIVGDMQPQGGVVNVAVDVSSTNKVELYWYTGVAVRATSVDSVQPNQWNYFAIVVNANAITIYVNSTTAGQTGTTTLTTRSLGASGWGMGSINSGEHFTGYMSSIRWSVGIARTISAIPTAPTAPDNYSSFLMSFNNAGVVDATSRHVLGTLGNATISNASSKFGTGSIYFDGSSDGLFEPYNPQYAFGTGDFTIEFWINFASKAGYQTIMSFGYTTPVTGGWIIQTGNGDGNLIFYLMNAGTATAIATESGSTVNNGTWYHVMIVKTGGNTRIYRNGTQVATGTDTNNYSPTGAAFYFGGGSHVGFDNYYFNGYLDDLRITRYARTVAVPTTTFLTK